MKVTISVFGRYHAFYLAAQLYKHNYLHRLITTYPNYEVQKYQIPRDKVSNLVGFELVRRSWDKFPDSIHTKFNPQFILHESFDILAKGLIPEDTDLYVGWSSFSERGLHVAKNFGAITVLERGSAHIHYQNSILQEEYDYYGVKGELPHPQIIEKEIREYELADYISVPSTFVFRSFIDSGLSPSKLVKIPYGVDIQSFRQLPRRDNKFRVVYAGRMALQKGVQYLLQAFAELRLFDAELWLIGGITSEMEPFFKKYEGYFQYFGHVPQHELAQYYSQCTVFALCSIQDGFGMVLPQAMASGLSIICTTNTGGEDLIEDGKEGFIIPIRDIESLKARILYLYQNPEVAEIMGQAALHRVAAGHSWDDYGDQVIAAYTKIWKKQEKESCT